MMVFFLEEMYFMLACDCLPFSHMHNDRSTPSRNSGDTADHDYQTSQFLDRLSKSNFIVSSYNLTTHTNHCSISCLILCDWYLVIKLKSINFLY